MKKCSLIFSIACVFLFAGNSFAIGRRFQNFSGCCSVPIKSNVFVEKQVLIQEVPVAFPILVPAYQFQYQQPCYSAVLPAPSALSVAPPMPNYGQQNYGQQNYGHNNMLNQNDMVRQLARALLEEMDRLAQRQEVNEGPPIASGPMIQSYNSTTPYNSPYNPYGNNSPYNTPFGNQQLQTVAVNAMARACAACHTGVGSKGGMRLFIQPGLMNANAPWSTIEKEVSRGSMPPKDSQWRLTVSEMDAIIKFTKSMSR